MKTYCVNLTPHEQNDGFYNISEQRKMELLVLNNVSAYKFELLKCFIVLNYQEVGTISFCLDFGAENNLEAYNSILCF